MGTILRSRSLDFITWSQDCFLQEHATVLAFGALGVIGPMGRPSINTFRRS